MTSRAALIRSDVANACPSQYRASYSTAEPSGRSLSAIKAPRASRTVASSSSTTSRKPSSPWTRTSPSIHRTARTTPLPTNGSESNAAVAGVASIRPARKTAESNLRRIAFSFRENLQRRDDAAVDQHLLAFAGGDKIEKPLGQALARPQRDDPALLVIVILAALDRVVGSRDAADRQYFDVRALQQVGAAVHQRDDFRPPVDGVHELVPAHDEDGVGAQLKILEAGDLLAHLRVVVVVFSPRHHGDLSFSAADLFPRLDPAAENIADLRLGE